MGIWTKQGLIYLAGILDAGINVGLSKIRLFQNDYVPTVDSVQEDLVECDFDGYNPNEFTGGFFAPAFINDDDRAERSLPVFVNVRGEGPTSNDVYGWYWGHDRGLVCAERFADAPRPMVTPFVDEIVVHPRILVGNVPPPP